MPQRLKPSVSRRAIGTSELVPFPGSNRVEMAFLIFSVSLCLRGEIFLYLNFSVVSANNANTSDAIQKRTMTLDSDQPRSSK
jgi:hypothetical protein